MSQLQTLRDLYFNFQNYEQSSKSLRKCQIQSDSQLSKRHTEHDQDHDESNKRAKTKDSSDTTELGIREEDYSDANTYSSPESESPPEECQVLVPKFTMKEMVQRFIDEAPHGAYAKLE